MLPDLIRWDPVRELVAMRGDMDRLFSRVASGQSTLPRHWSPTADVIEQDDQILITAELPGVKDEDIEITVQDGMLRIAGERLLEDEVSDDGYHRVERSYGRFERTFPLPPGVKEEDISAGVAYGVLKIRIPKPTATEPRRIAVGSEA
jgi:HSP20 family protein